MWMTVPFQWRHSILLVILFGMTACSPLGLMSEKEAEFAALYPDISFSGYLNLSLAEDLGPPDDRFSVAVVIENISDQIILLPADSAHELFIFDKSEKEWKPIKERMNYTINEKTYLYPEDNLDKYQFKISALRVRPDFVISDEPVTVRLVLIGDVIEKDQPTGKKVGAYIDIIYEPR